MIWKRIFKDGSCVWFLQGQLYTHRQGSWEVTCPVCEHSFFPTPWILSWCLCAFHACLQRTFRVYTLSHSARRASNHFVSCSPHAPRVFGLVQKWHKTLPQQTCHHGGTTPGLRSYSAKQTFMKTLGLPVMPPVLPGHLVYLNLGSSSIFIGVPKNSTNKVLRILLSTQVDLFLSFCHFCTPSGGKMGLNLI